MNMLTKRISAGAMLFVAMSMARADGLLKVEQTVFGMDCAPCAYGLQKGLSKLPGATKVDVSLNDGSATVEFGPNSATTFSQVHDVIVNGGFTPREAIVTASGHITIEGGQLFLVENPAERFLLIVPQGMDTGSLKAGAAVTVQGQVAAETSSSPVQSLTVRKILESTP
jgi:copper chaperone CopZ